METTGHARSGNREDSGVFQEIAFIRIGTTLPLNSRQTGTWHGPALVPLPGVRNLVTVPLLPATSDALWYHLMSRAAQTSILAAHNPAQ